jgi:hypothetical protein
MHVLANYYGFGSVYADTVRDWVYGDTREFLFFTRLLVLQGPGRQDLLVKFTWTESTP